MITVYIVLIGHPVKKIEALTLSFNTSVDIKQLLPVSFILLYWTHVYNSLKLLKCLSSLNIRKHIVSKETFTSAINYRPVNVTTRGVSTELRTTSEYAT